MNYRIRVDIPENITGFDNIKFVTGEYLLTETGQVNVLYIVDNLEQWGWDGSGFFKIGISLDSNNNLIIISPSRHASAITNSYIFNSPEHNLNYTIYDYSCNNYLFNSSSINIFGRNNKFDNCNNIVGGKYIYGSEESFIENCEFINCNNIDNLIGGELIVNNKFININSVDFDINGRCASLYPYLTDSSMYCEVRVYDLGIILSYIDSTGLHVIVV